jgi:hypothetical protein
MSRGRVEWFAYAVLKQTEGGQRRFRARNFPTAQVQTALERNIRLGLLTRTSRIFLSFENNRSRCLHFSIS